MYLDLKNGAVVNCNGTIIRISISRGVKYIFWENFGRSAERLGLNNLRFICMRIAHSKDYSYTIINNN